MTLALVNGEVVKSFEGKIERRGGISISYPKHSYEIDLKKDISLANLPEDDDWILNANYIDKTFLRHVISYELFQEMSPNNRASNCQFIEVELNGVYNGLYVLMEKLDKSSLDVNGKDSMSFIFKEPHLFRKAYKNIKPQDSTNFHQQTYPKLKVEDKRATLEEIRALILTGNDSTFRHDIPRLFDLNNLIDWHLLLLISNNSDGILKNFYLYKPDAKTPIRIAPWDYDHSFGRDGDNELNLDQRPLKIERSILFARLMKHAWYTSQLKARWQQHNLSNLLSEKSLKQRVIHRSKNIKERTTKNFELWPLNGKRYYDENNVKQEVNIMLQYIELRHQRLREYFKAF